MCFFRLTARIRVIGAVGGQFWQSRNELISTLGRWKATDVILFPDAGSVLNHCFVLDYFSTFHCIAKYLR